MVKPSNKKVFVGGFKKLFNEQWGTDILLKAGDSDEGRAFPVHKILLAARSEVFKKMLESDECKTSNKLETVTLSEMKHEELKAFVHFMYSNSGSIPSETLKKHVKSLYIAADKYEIPHLRDLCRNQLISSLDSSNALSVLELAQIPFDTALNDAAFTIIKTKISLIIHSQEFKLFVVNNPNLAVEVMEATLGYQKGSCNCCASYYK